MPGGRGGPGGPCTGPCGMAGPGGPCIGGPGGRTGPAIGPCGGGGPSGRGASSGLSISLRSPSKTFYCSPKASMELYDRNFGNLIPIRPEAIFVNFQKYLCVNFQKYLC